jgi:hypothetical protein
MGLAPVLIFLFHLVSETLPTELRSACSRGGTCPSNFTFPIQHGAHFSKFILEFN